MQSVSRGARARKRRLASSDVFVAPAAEIHQDQIVRVALRRESAREGDRVRALQRRQNSFGACEAVEGFDGLRIGNVHVRSATALFEERVLRPNAGIIEAGADRVRLTYLALRALQQI